MSISGLDTLTYAASVAYYKAHGGGGSGGTGVSEHNKLKNLSYELSGHTGFQKALTVEQIVNLAKIPNKLEQSDINDLVRALALNEAGDLVVTSENGTVVTLPMFKDSVVDDGYYNEETSTLVLILNTGKEISIPAEALVTLFYGDGTTIVLDPTTNIFSIAPAILEKVNSIIDKVDKVEGFSLSKNSFSDEEKAKLASLYNYTLPQATTGALGGIKADAITDGDGYTEDVKIDPSTGKVKVKPGGGEGSIQPPTPTTLGGFKAKEKTALQTLPVGYDPVTGQGYVENGGSSLPEGGTKGQALTILEDTPKRELGWVTQGALSEPAIGDIIWSPRRAVVESDRYALCDGTTIDVGGNELFIKALELSPVMEWDIKTGLTSVKRCFIGVLPNGKLLGFSTGGSSDISNLFVIISEDNGRNFVTHGSIPGNYPACINLHYSPNKLQICIKGGTSTVPSQYRAYTDENTFSSFDIGADITGNVGTNATAFDDDSMYLFCDTAKLYRITSEEATLLKTFTTTQQWLSADLDLINNTIMYSTNSGVFEASLDTLEFEQITTKGGRVCYSDDGDIILVSTDGSYVYPKENRQEIVAVNGPINGQPLYINGMCVSVNSPTGHYSVDNGKTYNTFPQNSLYVTLGNGNMIHNQSDYIMVGSSPRYFNDSPVQRADYTTPNLGSPLAFIRLS